VPAVPAAPANSRIRPLAVVTAVLVTVGLLAFVPLVRESAPYTAPTLTTVALLRFARVREAMLASLLTVPMALAVTLWLRVGDGVPTTELSRFALMAVVFVVFLQIARRVEVTQQQLADETETIRRERDLLQGILATSPAGVVVADAQGAIEFANARALQILSLTPEQAIGLRFDAAECAAAVEGAEPVEQHPFAQVRDQQAPVYGIEQRLPMPDGGARVLSINGAPRFDATGHFAGGVFTFHDITEPHEAQRRLREQEALQARVSDALPGVLFQLVRGPDGIERFTFVGERAAELLGMPADRLLDPTVDLWSILTQDQVPRLREVLNESATTLGPLRGQIRYHDTRGFTRWAQVDAGPSLEADGTVQWNGLFTDITERKLLEQSLQQAQKLEGLGLLAGGVAHDFNNLLGVIRLSAESLQQALPEQDDPPQELREITDATERASGLTKQLLLFSRPQVERMEPLDLAAVVRDSARLFGRLLGARITLHVEVPPSAVCIVGDRTGLEQVLLNLVVNSRDAMPEGGRIVMRVLSPSATEVAPSRCTLEVEDTGMGMDEATLEHIFEPFFTTKPEGAGTGLGLPTVQRIVTQLGGRTHVKSLPGQGTCVQLDFPLAPAPLPALTADA
jgi:PAS domain S-box-containing protein